MTTLLEESRELGTYQSQCLRYFTVSPRILATLRTAKSPGKAMLNVDNILKGVIVLGQQNKPARILDIT